jgi:class 3 adenylate cyclase
MKCPKCQFENRKDVKFCNECGSKLEISCSKCGKINPPDSKFCNECGHNLSTLQKTSFVDYSKPQSYTPKFLADKILTSRSSLEGERKLVTVLFADVANYTSMSEKLDPEEVHLIMDGCFKILMDEIHHYEGTINQFTGDGVMALFGAPVAHEDNAQRACYAALSIQKALENYSEKIQQDHGVDFKMRIGLNSGPVVVAAIGEDLRMDYTAIGDTTNFASRIESLARPGTIMLSKNTYRLVKDFFEIKCLGIMEVKGKEKPQRIFELIKAGKVETRIGASIAKGLTRFVGRKNSMAVLMEAYEKAKSGSGQVVGIIGEAGVGKSRLLLEFRNRLPQGQFNYFEGRCLHYGESMPYLPVLDIIRSYFDIKDGDRDTTIRTKVENKIQNLEEKLQIYFTSFLDLLSVKVEDEPYLRLEPKQKRDRTFEALRNLLIYKSRIRPLIVAIEDLHWVDKISEEFLGYLINMMANVKVLLLLLYRPEYTHKWGSKSYYNKVGVEQLTSQSSAELVQAILEEAEVVPEIKKLIIDRTAGNPLFMEELTHSLLENGTIKKTDRCYMLGKNADDIKCPDTIQGIIAARMDRLEENIKSILQLASVIGKEFAYRILQTITGLQEELKYHLLNLQRLEFIYEKSLFPELEYIFKHAITQEVAYNSLLTSRRRKIHLNVAAAIEQIYAKEVSAYYPDLVYHYGLAEEFKKERHYAKLAGEQAAERFANAEAISHFSKALELTLAKDLHERYTLLLDRERVYDLQGQRKLQAKDLKSLSDLIEKLGGNTKQIAERRGILALRKANYALVTGKYSKATSEALNAIEQGSIAKDMSIQAEGYLLWGLSLRRTGDLKMSQLQLEKALFLAKEAGTRGLEANCLRIIGNVLFFQNKYAGAVRYWQQSLPICREIGDRVCEAGSLNGLGEVARALGDYSGARQYYEQRLKICRDIGDRQGETIALANLGLVAHNTGDNEEAYEYSQWMLQIAQESKHISHQAYAMNNMGHALVGLAKRFRQQPELAKGEADNHLNKAARLYKSAVAFRQEIGEHYLVMESLAGLARVYLVQDDIHKAKKKVETILCYLKSNSLEGTDEPMRIYLTCYLVLKVNNDPRAKEILRAAHSMLNAWSANVTDDETRNSFLQKVEFNREIMREAECILDT